MGDLNRDDDRFALLGLGLLAEQRVQELEMHGSRRAAAFEQWPTPHTKVR